MNGAQLLILHLSDIHFRKSEIGTAQDPNFHLRNELLRDLRQQCDRIGPPVVIIVSGDVAFSGDPEEFAFATEWLERVCDACGGSLRLVFVCPGNHDVVREQADRNLVQLIHNAIKNAQDTNDEIAKQLRDKDARRLLYESLDNYNAFALQFFCDLLPPDRTRTTRDVQLNDGSILRIWGLNTAFVSSSRDRPGDIFVDPASFQITREDGVVNLVVVHHHLSWLRQQRALEDHLNDVAPIQMFGHVHTNRIDMNVDYMRLTASAANPDRREPGWEPGYNLLEVRILGAGKERRLQMRAHVRVWQTAPGGFQAKRSRQSEFFDHSVPLGEWHRGTTVAAMPVSTPIGYLQSINTASTIDTPPEGGRAMNTLRDVGIRFYRLSFSKKSEIAGRLELLEEDDMTQPDYERFRRVFLRAHERGRLDELAAAVHAAEQS